MRINVVPIGNSKGIRIPKAVLQQCDIKKYVDLEIEDKHIVITPIQKKPRKDWAESFEKMHKNKHDQPLIDDRLDLKIEDWKW